MIQILLFGRYKNILQDSHSSTSLDAVDKEMFDFSRVQHVLH